ncbi:glycosyltransferase family 29 protein [Celeribacter arenosi]|uniref:Glycosyltransferase family 29 protein n=1 Tax=Celeribacter arenosi TaxID=792649 RepID=A0ABP7K0X1_9RHOB
MIGWYLSKLQRSSSYAERFSLSREDILARLSAKSVAIVGNARALCETSQGSDIDAADIVIRINSAPMPAAASHGQRTDWLAMSTPVSQAIVQERAPDLLMWMTPKRRRLPLRIARHRDFYLNAIDDWQRLRATLPANPTTGLMVIDLAAASNASRVDLYGFDFFSSLSLSGRRSAEQVPHDFGSEREWVEQRMGADSRLTLHPMK